MALPDIKRDFSPLLNLTEISSNTVLGEEVKREEQNKEKFISSTACKAENLF